MDAYVGRVHAVVIALSDYLSPNDLGLADHLIDHGEPPEALISLAWAIVESGVHVPEWTIDAIYELGEGINDPSHLPPNLRDFRIGA